MAPPGARARYAMGTKIFGKGMGLALPLKTSLLQTLLCATARSQVVLEWRQEATRVAMAGYFAYNILPQGWKFTKPAIRGIVRGSDGNFVPCDGCDGKHDKLFSVHEHGESEMGSWSQDVIYCGACLQTKL